MDASKNGDGTNEPIRSLHELDKHAWQNEASTLQLLAKNPIWAEEIKDKRGGSGALPLQQALKYGASPKVVRALLDAYPEAAKMKVRAVATLVYPPRRNNV